MADEKSKSILMVIAIVVVILIVDIIGGLIIAKKILIPKTFNTIDMGGEPERSGEENTSEQSEALGFTHEIEAITLNPANSVGEIFSCQITLETKEQPVIEELTARDPQIKDIIITYFSHKNVQELNDISKREEYKNELIESINSVLLEGSINNIYTPQWILQFD
ncbi:flagellar basal body-associated protein FliL [Candidatus Latescibacterota bacterium]